MLVADTSALCSLGTVELAATMCGEFDVHTTETVVAELRETAEFNDRHAVAARRVLDVADELTVHDVDASVQSARIDEGEGSAAALANELDAEFLITDDLRALAELRSLVDARVSFSPVVLRALVERGVLTEQAARDHLDEMAADRSWLETPIYLRARRIFEEN